MSTSKSPPPGGLTRLARSRATRRSAVRRAEGLDGPSGGGIYRSTALTTERCLLTCRRLHDFSANHVKSCASTKRKISDAYLRDHAPLYFMVHDRFAEDEEPDDIRLLAPMLCITRSMVCSVDLLAERVDLYRR
jgi:hypothetical protein